MEFIYVLLPEEDKSGWDDMQIFTNELLAINASKKYPDGRVEIFEKSVDGHYMPSFSYFKCGIFITIYN